MKLLIGVKFLSEGTISYRLRLDAGPVRRLVFAAQVRLLNGRANAGSTDFIRQRFLLADYQYSAPAELQT